MGGGLEGKQPDLEQTLDTARQSDTLRTTLLFFSNNTQNTMLFERVYIDKNQDSVIRETE